MVKPLEGFIVKGTEGPLEDGELEQHKTFLFRNAAGAVTWAYPVTVDPTPHRISFSTGERINAA